MGIFPLAANAQDVGRLDQLEREIREIKLRLATLEASRPPGEEQKPLAGGEGWKYLQSWRRLKTGMSPNEVRAILGEPSRVRGGEIADWSYANGGVSTFMMDKLFRWVEPN